MGPTNLALVKLFRADQKLREAQGRLEAATKNVRVQERKVNELAERVKAATTTLREVQTKSGQFELEVKTREARIDKLREQQQNANNNKEYQAFLVEISTEKVDRGKAEDELIKVMEQTEKAQADLKDLTAHHTSEQEKLVAMRGLVGETVARLTAEVEALRPDRNAAAEAVPPRHLHVFERLAERHEGEALSALSKPDRRREEYLCSACMMDLVADVYNRLHSRDDVIFCTSCGRFLFIPEDLPPEVAINSRGKSDSSRENVLGAKAPKTKRTKATVGKLNASERRAKGKLGDLLAGAQGESVKIAVDGGLKPVECEVIVDGKARGLYKGKNGEHLHRIILIRMEEAGMKGQVEVREKTAEPVDASASTAASAAPETATPTAVAASLDASAEIPNTDTAASAPAVNPPAPTAANGSSESAASAEPATSTEPVATTESTTPEETEATSAADASREPATSGSK